MDSAVSILFAGGRRPDASAVNELVQADGGFSVSYDPQPEAGEHWLELLASGLTFDLTGLAPGPPMEKPRRVQSFGLPDRLDAGAMEAIRLAPGPHLSGAGRMVPVLRCQAWLAAQLAALPGVHAVAWHPAESWCAPDYYRESVLRWIAGGAFPGLALTSLASQPDGSMRSVGLTPFAGQELHLLPGLTGDDAERAKIALRLLHWLVESGGIHEPSTLTGPSGEQLMLEPDTQFGTLRVWRGSR